ncbi:hypothetical protein ASPWEDRAFT_473316 [Aspergillus wentii DTO 134E9]|uniref:Xylanolytic transcriptional activator regulatory domain-containing protein n=1 Tax=Aspergillus wentii DTO 134E9 TaxID=1073089 RepID=A0A1L9RT20_ASPWE|nr:uncharacterized protein ASPWEDRAFT_473316 [Aspergillus wentii DTO 134E9]OJJ37998.1 hypothetical protein ASPWEDRAFT_473316 [Aspergillus wentii DTO 134E9]
MMESLDGLETLMLEARYHIHAGNLRPAWLLFRRALGIAQLMCLPRGDGDSRADSLWFWLVYSDRFLSLMLGLPLSVDGTLTINLYGTPRRLSELWMASRQYSGDESTRNRGCWSGVILMPNFVARKMSFRLSGFAANHFPRRSSEVLYSSADSLAIVPFRKRILTPVPECFAPLVCFVEEGHVLRFCKWHPVHSAGPHQAQSQTWNQWSVLAQLAHGGGCFKVGIVLFEIESGGVWNEMAVLIMIWEIAIYLWISGLTAKYSTCSLKPLNRKAIVVMHY